MRAHLKSGFADLRYGTRFTRQRSKIEKIGKRAEPSTDQRTRNNVGKIMMIVACATHGNQRRREYRPQRRDDTPTYGVTSHKLGLNRDKVKKTSE